MRISDWSSDVCSSDLHQPGLVAVPDGRGGIHHVVELGLVLGERREDAQPEHEAVEQYVHQHAEADHAEPDHRQHEFERHHAPPCDAAAASSDSSSPTDSGRAAVRSEEHTSELQSLMRISYAVFCLQNKKQ